MNRRLLFSLLGLVLVWIAFVGYVTTTSADLPERVATHFGTSGEANGWMSRGGHVQFTVVSGLLVPGFVLGLFYVIGRFPKQWLNIPDKDYWLAPERREETVTFIRLQGVRFATLFIGFLAAIHWSTVAANRHTPATLPNAHVGWIAGIFLAAAIVWAIVFTRRFIRRPS